MGMRENKDHKSQQNSKTAQQCAQQKSEKINHNELSH